MLAKSLSKLYKMWKLNVQEGDGFFGESCLYPMDFNPSDRASEGILLGSLISCVSSRLRGKEADP